MESVYFTSKLKRKLGILPNVFVLFFITLSIFITILAYFYGLNNTFVNANSSNLDIIKQNNLKLLSSPTNFENDNEGQGIDIFQERMDQEVQRSSDKITFGGEKYFLSAGCANIKDNNNCKLFKLTKDGDYTIIQENFDSIVSERFINYDSISFNSKQTDNQKFIGMSIDLNGRKKNTFNYDLVNNSIVIVNSGL